MSAAPGARSRPYERGLIDVLHLGQAPCADVLELCARLAEQRARDEVCDTLVFTEHGVLATVAPGTALPPALELATLEVERSGPPVLFGAGQLVVYPLLERTGADVARARRDLEEVLLRVLAEVELAPVRGANGGIELAGRQVARVAGPPAGGLAGWVMTLNVHLDPRELAAASPLGHTPERMTSLASELELPPHTLLFEVLTVKHACDVFGLALPPIPEPPPPPPGSLPIYPG